MLRSLLALTLGTAALTGCGTALTLGGDDRSAAASTPAPPARVRTTPPRTQAPPPRARTSAPDAPSTSRAEEPPQRAARRPPLDAWDVGATPLPVRPDGFGRVRATPPELRVRRMPTADVLPPPSSAGFRARVEPVTAGVRRRMGRSWTPRCPVALEDLRYLTLTFWGFDERRHTGELVVNRRVSRDVVTVFRRLYRARYPIEQMRLVTTADLAGPPTGDGNNTAALVCRSVRGGERWSAHAYGLAVDVNPFLNPYRNDDLVLPELASAYLDRAWRRPGMIHPGGVVVDAFTSVGWTWGGTFDSVSDPMHFSATGR